MTLVAVRIEAPRRTDYYARGGRFAAVGVLGLIFAGVFFVNIDDAHSHVGDGSVPASIAAPVTLVILAGLSVAVMFGIHDRRR